jgi:hypothetical protein
MQESLSKELLGLAGEYAVASELCRRGVYAQLTLGNHKQTDILVETEDHMLRISVKTKQRGEWPSITGLSRKDDFLVLVDFKEKSETDRPTFYILNIDDWKQLVSEEHQRFPDKTTVDELYRIKYADGWSGLNIKPIKVDHAKERWDKIILYYQQIEQN